MTQSHPDGTYREIIQTVLRHGTRLRTRNSNCARLRAIHSRFDRSPLIGIRKTAWKNALREWEWFMSGSNRIDDLHESVRPWWKPFCTIDKTTLPHNYSKAFRRIYAPEVGPVIEVQPSRMVEDEPVTIPRFELRQVVAGDAKHLGYEGINSHGDHFRVIDYLGDAFYLLQFSSNGYCIKSKPCNFLKGIAKNPYFPTVNGVGCFGVVNKNDYSYYKRAYALWCGFMGRCYNPARISYRWYGGKGIKVAARWKCFEYFIADLPNVPGFEEWLAAPGAYALDKDYRKANYYGPDVCIFLQCKRNTELAGAEQFYVVPRRVIEIDQVANFIDGIKNHPCSRRNSITTWIPQHIHSGLVNPTNCHSTIIQAFVESDNSLHFVTYQRSADLICGVPHNWIQMWAFLMWVAHQTGRAVGTLDWIGGDVHIYEAHYELAHKMVAADLVEMPELVYSPSSDAFLADDFSLSGPYSPVLTDRAEMIV